MKRWLLFILIILSNSWVQASELSSFLRFLSKEKTLLQPMSCEISDEDHFQACAVSLCGNPKKMEMYRPEKELLDLYDPKRFGDLSEVEKNLRGLLEQYQSRTQKNIKALSTQSMKEAYLKEFGDMDDESWEDLARRKFQSYVSEVYDESKPLGERYSISINLPEEPISDKMKRSLEMYIKKVAIDRNSLVSEVQGNVWSLSQEEVKGKLDSLWKDNKSVLEKLNPIEFQKMSDKIKSSADLGGYELKELLQSVAHLINKIAPALYCKDSECRKELAEMTIENDVSSLDKSLGSKDFVGNVLPVCLSSYVQHSVRKAEEEKFRKLIPEILSKFESKIMKNYSEHSRLAFKKVLNEISLDFGDRIDPSEKIKGFQTILNRQEELLSPKKYLEKFKSNGFEDAWAEISFCKPPIISENIFDGFLKADSIETDGTIKKTPLAISDVSCMHTEHGEKIFAHEVGHVLSYAIEQNLLSETSKVEFFKIRSCINGKVSNSFADDSKYTEEDMADHVAGIVYAEGEIHQKCTLLEHKNGKYLNLGFVNSIKHDTHSAAFTRLMREALYKKKKLGEACQQLYMQYKNQIRLDPCE